MKNWNMATILMVLAWIFLVIGQFGNMMAHYELKARIEALEAK